MMDLQGTDSVKNILYLRLLKICGEHQGIDRGKCLVMTEILWWSISRMSD